MTTPCFLTWFLFTLKSLSKYSMFGEFYLLIPVRRGKVRWSIVPILIPLKNTVRVLSLFKHTSVQIIRPFQFNSDSIKMWLLLHQTLLAWSKMCKCLENKLFSVSKLKGGCLFVCFTHSEEYHSLNNLLLHNNLWKVTRTGIYLYFCLKSSVVYLLHF